MPPGTSKKKSAGPEQPVASTEPSLSIGQLVEVLAARVMGLNSDEFELRNPPGNGFCWGAAPIAGWLPGLLRNFNVEKLPFENPDAVCTSCASDRKVEAVARDSAFGVAPTPNLETGATNRNLMASVVANAMDAGKKQKGPGATPSLHRLPMVSKGAPT